MAHSRTPGEPASVSQQDFWRVQQALHVHIHRGRRHVTTGDLTERVNVPKAEVRASMRIIAEVNPQVENVGVDEWTITMQ